MAILSREQIRERSSKALRYEDVPCPEFGEDAAIRVRQLRAGDLVAYQRLVLEHQKAGTDGELALLIVQMCAADEANQQLWPGEEGMEDIRALPGDVLTRLTEAASKLNGAEEEAALEEAVKN